MSDKQTINDKYKDIYDMEYIKKLYGNNYDANNGMLTKIWGPGMWIALHTITFGYPIKPTQEQKIYYKNFFFNLGNVIPCSYCRDSYNNFIKSKPSILDDNVMKNRITLSYWLYKIHNRVNDKLGIDYQVSFDDVIERYETYRAKCATNKNINKKEKEKEKGCIMPLNKKAKSFEIADTKDCPVISINLVEKFIPYSKIRGLDYRFEKIMKIVKAKNKCNKKIWNIRNILCQKIINKMRINNIESIEQNGPFKGLPTKHELKLMFLLSSNLCSDKLQEIVNNLDNFKINQLSEKTSVIAEKQNGGTNKIYKLNITNF